FWSHYRHSEIHAARSDYDAALARLQPAEELANQLQSTRLKAHVLHRRSAVLMASGEYDQAEPVLLKSLELDTSRGELRYVANDLFALAKVYKQKQEPEEVVLRFAHDANQLYQRLGMVEQIEESASLIQEIEDGP
ncbi:MAG: hypothetical protein AAFU38_16915, partial [Bacteroidota bacterium]